MTQPSDLQTQSRELNASMERAETQETFTNSNINIVIGLLTLVAFIPLFLDREVYSSIGRFLIILFFGFAYLAMAILGTAWHEKRLTLFSAFVYFSIQITFVLVLHLLATSFRNNFWLLFLPLAGQGLSMKRWKGAAVVTVIMLTAYTLLNLYLFRERLSADFLQELFNAIISIGSAMFFVILFTYIALREGETRLEIAQLAKELRQANYRLAEYAGQIEELATTRERNRLAREIHDNLGHYLTVINVQIEAARAMMDKDSEKSADSLEKAQRLTQEGLSSVRQSVSALRDSPLGDKSLTDAVEALAEETRGSGLAVSLNVQGAERPLLPKTALTLYRTVQEGLTNARKHAQATAVFIQLDYSDPKQVQLTLQDDGQGSANPSGGFGLLGVRERIQLLHGTFTLKTAPGEGFHLHIIIPTNEATE